MLLRKVDLRIRQYIHFLKGLRYTVLERPAFEVFETEKVYRKPPVVDTWKPIQFPYPYGKEWTTYWFRTFFTVPESARGKEIFLQATPNADSLVFINGKATGAINPFHDEIRLSPSGMQGTQYEIHLESYAGHKYPGEHPFQGESVILTLGAHIDDYPNIFRHAALTAKNQNVYALYHDVRILFDLAQNLDENSLRKNRILQELYRGLMKIRFTARDDELEDQVQRAREIITPLLLEKNSRTSPEIFLVGHAHIDHAWLWPIWETERKVARTFANMAHFAEEFEEFVFVQSQPAQLEIIQREYPDIFASVKAAFERGQWEPNGGMWVEADCNLSGGESLIRQFLVGKQASQKLLGYEGDTLWLPDVFGYSAALPQILKGCEIEYFVTSKINWNDTTRFPYDTFIWRGLDGTGLKTHYITSRANGYNGKVTPTDLMDAWNHIQHKEVQEAVIKPIGEGDGGGGTTRADLEAARRLKDLEGVPKSRWSRVSSALATVFEKARDLPEWRGELYLELHRGTYTTQARTKRNNRKMEFALREIEFLYSFLYIIDQKSLLFYPREELLDCWKRLLTNQFHDIIPGSSINRVYKDAEIEYERIRKTAEFLLRKGAEALLVKLENSNMTYALAEYHEVDDQNVSGNQIAAILVLNSLSWERTTDVVLPLPEILKGQFQSLRTAKGLVPIQESRNILDQIELHAVVTMPPMGAIVFVLEECPLKVMNTIPFQYRGKHLLTPYYEVEFNETKGIIHLVDRQTKREFVESGKVFNSFVGAEDLPILWDAWDIDADWVESQEIENRLIASELISIGFLFIQIRNKYRIGRQSTLTQDVYFYAHNRRIDFVTLIDWHESHRLLKVAFPVNLYTTQVRCEVQYGHVFRSTHNNLPQDRAQFEFCAHKWISLEENGASVALLNDCKYGYDVDGTVMRLTLLRSPKAPDREADMGLHQVTYSILPFCGPFSVETTVHAAYDLNQPCNVFGLKKMSTPPLKNKQIKEWLSVFSVDTPQVIIETVKMAEDGNDIILRLYEASGGACFANLDCLGSIELAVETNMLERNPIPLDFEEHSVHLSFRAFEIKTVRLKLTYVSLS
ncbi:alpha-mannosidase [Gracilinema caldarium]|uniref:Alpha-mannosidase n=1 Tax=Gracilinema caldarium (strain ATCC 51460 / DSM 7334 / H1) TaxID=744872 RepID=F8F420_GRAC1|nr:glycoside hydrolase family 38 C-terminal domain-containing protein [Gracilinema caldarium]AEJ20039.1 Alpha-mannosidase [Gracilinema caldarium DSM 7334]